ncbi:MAG: cobyrinate a,c-diamide synthase [Cycloclasticus sp.]|nr:cobyrinate a,c-diamide synthase [Cycloclasticus sp.]
MRSCPALFISAPASGQGKTTVTAALARYHRDQGRRVCVFKTGPDFLDPMILEQASGAPVYQLDLWMGGEDHCRQLLYEVADKADLILIEGVMGLFDGNPCSADLATLFNIPVMVVIDSTAIAQTFGALALGLASYRGELPFAGVFANRVASQSHYQMLNESLPSELTSFGWLARNADFTLPERHLGLLQAIEIDDLDERIAKTAAALNGVGDVMPEAVSFEDLTSSKQSKTSYPLYLKGVRIGVARDHAFSFLYRSNINILVEMGAEINFFSPLYDNIIPEVDALYLPGGYPELHLKSLTTNEPMKAEIFAHHTAGKAIVAECGGMLYLLDSLTDSEGRRGSMVGLLPGKAEMTTRLTNLGLHSVVLPEGELRGHTFHHSKMQCDLKPIVYTESARHHGTPEPIYRQGRLTATYLHFYFSYSPEVSAKLFLP